MSSVPDTPNAAGEKAHAADAQVKAEQSLSAVQAFALGIGYIALWWLCHRYRGFDHDGLLYVFQAMAHLQPSLAGDIFLGQGSQDDYTIFTAIYATLISRLGPGPASALLLVTSQLTLAVSGWYLIRRFYSGRAAWFALAMWIVLPTYYGGFEVFKVGEEFVTARLVAEALSLAALVMWTRLQRIPALIAVAVAAGIHPLVVAPVVGAALLLEIPQSRWPALIGAGAASLAVIIAIAHIAPMGPISIVDPEWLEIVVMRSEHVLLLEWRWADWSRVLVVLGTVTMGALTAPHERLRRLLIASGAIAVVSLVVSLVAGDIASLHLSLLAQPWRAMWITTSLALFVIAPVVYTAMKESRTGQVAAVLLIASWVFVDTAGILLAPVAVLVWRYRHLLAGRHERAMVWLAQGVAILIVASTLGSLLQTLFIDFSMGSEAVWVERIRNVMGLTVPATVIALLTCHLVIRRWPQPGTVAVVLGLTAILGVMLPPILRQVAEPPYYGRFAQEREHFEPWRRLIPPDSNVFWQASHTAVWMLLERPSYVSRSSGAGVVFSRGIAMEIKRRAYQLEPYVNPLYTLGGRMEEGDLKSTTLTAESLRQVCSDPQLGFVVSNAEIEGGIPNTSLDPEWKEYRLFDCSKQRTP